MLLGAQVLTVGVARAAPASVTDWAVAAVCAALVLGTHVLLALLAAWPPGAALPHATAARWARQTGVLAAAGMLAAMVGALAAATPVGWGPWLGALALAAVAGSATQVGLATRRRR